MCIRDSQEEEAELKQRSEHRPGRGALIEDGALPLRQRRGQECGAEEEAADDLTGDARLPQAHEELAAGVGADQEQDQRDQQADDVRVAEAHQPHPSDRRAEIPRSRAIHRSGPWKPSGSPGTPPSIGPPRLANLSAGGNGIAWQGSRDMSEGRPVKPPMSTLNPPASGEPVSNTKMAEGQGFEPWIGLHL